MCNGLGGWKAQLGAECTIKNYTRRTLRSVYGYLNVGSKDKCCVYLCGGRCVDTDESSGDWCWYLDSILYLVTALLLSPLGAQEASAISWTNILPWPLPRHSSPPPPAQAQLSKHLILETAVCQIYLFSILWTTKNNYFCGIETCEHYRYSSTWNQKKSHQLLGSFYLWCRVLWILNAFLDLKINQM